MAVVTIHEAKTHLSKLLTRVALGETIIIARNGRPIAQLLAISIQHATRKPGLGKGGVWLSENWDSPESNASVAALFGMQIAPISERKPVRAKTNRRGH